MKRINLLSAGIIYLFCYFPFFAFGQLYWNTNGTPATWTDANWGTSGSGPFTYTWSNNSQSVFNSNSSVTWVTNTQIGNINVNSGVSVTLIPSGTLSTNGNIRTMDIGSGGSLDFASQAISTASGTGFIKSNSGTWNIGSGSAYPGGFTLNAGTVIVSGNNSFGTGSMTVNGGNIQSSGTKNFASSDLTITGDYTLSGTGDATWGMNVAIGSSTRTITNSTSSGSRTFSGVISGGSGAGITFNGSGSGKIILKGANTYTGLTTVSGSTLQLNRSGGGTLPSGNNCSINGGTLQISSDQTLNNLELTSGTLVVDNGIILTIDGVFTRNPGTAINLNSTGAIQYGSSAVLLYDGGSNQTTSDKEWPSVNGPSSVTVGANGITLHADRTLSGTLTLNGKMMLGAKNLILGSTASISGANSTNYVVTGSSGYLQWNSVTSAKDFPVGNSTFNPVNLSNAGTADNFRVNVADMVLDAGTSGTALTSGIVERNWTISEENAGGSNVTITVQWNAANELTGFNRNSCYLAHFTGGIWVDNTAAAASGSNPFAISRSGITSFSPFSVGSGGALPVELLRLNAFKLNQTALIKWSTATELNNEYFTIERRTPDINYETIGSVKGAGNSSSILNYSFCDKNPVINTLNYYRIVQHDYSGLSKSFGPVSVRFENSISGILTSPGPFENYLILNFGDEFENEKIEVTNCMGQLVCEQVLNGQSPIFINTELWKPGIYFISVLSRGYAKTLRQQKL